MPLELFNQPRITVTSIQILPSQARTLEFAYAGKIDDGFTWSDYPLVQYNDPDLGLIFLGKVVEPERALKNGEGVVFRCADLGRMIEKTTARIVCPNSLPIISAPGVSSIRIRIGTPIVDAVTRVSAGVMDSFPGGIDYQLPAVGATQSGPTWSGASDYSIGDIANYSGARYRCTAGIAGSASTGGAPPGPPPTDSGHWTLTAAAPVAATGAAWSPIKNYNIDDLVTYSGTLYVCLARIWGSASQQLAQMFPSVDAVHWAALSDGNAPALPGRLPITLDKTGQKISVWFNDILDQTPSGIWYVDYIDGNAKIVIADYATVSQIDLAQGNYALMTPNATNPLVQTGQVKRSTNNKYQSVIVEGAGAFTRRCNVSIAATLAFVPYTDDVGASSRTWHYRFYFPHTNVCGLYLDANHACADGMFFHFVYTSHPNGGTQTTDTGENNFYNVTQDLDMYLPIGSTTINPHYLHWYAPFDVPTLIDDAVTFNSALFRYTSYDGPLSVSITSDDPALAGEGDFPIHRSEFYKFTSPGFRSVYNTLSETYTWEDDTATIDLTENTVIVIEARAAIDPTVEMTALAAIYAPRFSTVPDHTGALTVIVHGITAGIKLGYMVSNFNGMRVAGINIKPNLKQMALTLSDIPIRSELNVERDLKVIRGELYGNKRSKTALEDLTCFPDITLDANCYIVPFAGDPTGVLPPFRH